LEDRFRGEYTWAEIIEVVAAAIRRWMGKGEKNIADQVAVEAMRERMNKIICGSHRHWGRRTDEAMLYIGKKSASAPVKTPKPTATLMN